MPLIACSISLGSSSVWSGNGWSSLLIDFCCWACCWGCELLDSLDLIVAATVLPPPPLLDADPVSDTSSSAIISKFFFPTEEFTAAEEEAILDDGLVTAEAAAATDGFVGINWRGAIGGNTVCCCCRKVTGVVLAEVDACGDAVAALGCLGFDAVVRLRIMLKSELPWRFCWSVWISWNSSTSSPCRYSCSKLANEPNYENRKIIYYIIITSEYQQSLNLN